MVISSFKSPTYSFANSCVVFFLTSVCSGFSESTTSASLTSPVVTFSLATVPTTLPPSSAFFLVASSRVSISSCLPSNASLTPSVSTLVSSSFFSGSLTSIPKKFNPLTITPETAFAAVSLPRLSKKFVPPLTVPTANEANTVPPIGVEATNELTTILVNPLTTVAPVSTTIPAILFTSSVSIPSERSTPVKFFNKLFPNPFAQSPTFLASGTLKAEITFPSIDAPVTNKLVELVIAVCVASPALVNPKIDSINFATCANSAEANACKTPAFVLQSSAFALQSSAFC